MPYGTIKIDTITFTDAGVDKSIAVSGLVQNPTFTGNVTVTGTVSGTTVRATTVSGVTVSGTTANFASGVFTTQISGAIHVAPAGTAGAPSVQIGTGASIAPGLYSPTTDQLGISTGGSFRLVVDSTGRVGIGTANPTELLQLSADTDPKIHFVDVGNTTAKIGIVGSTALGFEMAGSERLRIDSSGRVGIGTTSPTQLLHVGGVTTPTVSATPTAIRLDNTFTGSPATNQKLKFYLYNDGSEAYGITIGDQADFQYWAGGGSTGIHRWFTSNTERLRIDSSGRVGIGTSSPLSAYLLDCRGNVKFGSSSTAGIYLGVDSNIPFIQGYDAGATYNQLKFLVGGIEAARIDSSGRLLVGTSSARSTSTINWLSQVEGTSFTGHGITNNSNDNAGAYLSLAKSRGTAVGSNTIVQNNDGLGYILFSGADGTDANTQAALIGCEVDGTPGVNDMPGRLVFSTTADGAANPTERMRITSTGNVGIGTSSPVYNLDVTSNGTTIIRSYGSAGNQAYISAAGNAGVPGTSSFDLIQDGSSIAYIYQRANQPLIFGTSNNERLRIDSSGNVGIGTTALAVTPRISVECANFGIAINTTNGGANEAMRFYNAGTAVGTITTTGSATAYNTSSDYRLKENIEAVADGITRLKQLNPSRFNFIADPDTTVDGFIAHEVQVVVPEAITGEKDAEDDDGNPIYQGIDQSKLVPLLTAALQEAIAKIETLEAKVAVLESA